MKHYKRVQARARNLAALLISAWWVHELASQQPPRRMILFDAVQLTSIESLRVQFAIADGAKLLGFIRRQML